MGRLGGVRTESPVAGVGPVGVAPLPDWGKRLVAVEPPLQVEVLRRVVANKDGAEQFLGETAVEAGPCSRPAHSHAASISLARAAAVTRSGSTVQTPPPVSVSVNRSKSWIPASANVFLRDRSTLSLVWKVGVPCS